MGRATAHLFSDEGAKVAVCDINAEGVETVVGEILESGGSAKGYVVDLQNGDAPSELVDQVRSDLGPIDILVNNAGVSIGGPIDSPDFEDFWNVTFAVNLDAQMRLIRACLDDLCREQRGRQGGRRIREFAHGPSPCAICSVGVASTHGRSLRPGNARPE